MHAATGVVDDENSCNSPVDTETEKCGSVKEDGKMKDPEANPDGNNKIAQKEQKNENVSFHRPTKNISLILCM